MVVDEITVYVVGVVVFHVVCVCVCLCVFFFQAEDGIRDLVRSRGLGDVYKRQIVVDLQRSLQGHRLHLAWRRGNNAPSGSDP